jgi:hypothetical protein
MLYQVLIGLLPVSDWKHSGCAGFALSPCTYYSLRVTVLSGLPGTHPSSVVTEFSVEGKKNHVA